MKNTQCKDPLKPYKTLDEMRKKHMFNITKSILILFLFYMLFVDVSLTWINHWDYNTFITFNALFLAWFSVCLLWWNIKLRIYSKTILYHDYFFDRVFTFGGFGVIILIFTIFCIHVTYSQKNAHLFYFGLIGYIIYITIVTIKVLRASVKNCFSKSYYLYAGKLLYHGAIIDLQNPVSKDKSCGSFLVNYLSLLVVYTLVARSTEDQAMFANSGVFGCILIFCIFYPMFLVEFYQTLIVVPHIEAHFKQPMLADPFKILEYDSELVKKFFGENPEKRPIQYEEVFPEAVKGFKRE